MAGDALSKLDGKSGQGSFPIPDGHRPLLADVAQGQIKQLGQRLIAGKRAPILAQLAQPHVDRLDGIGRVDDLANFGRVVKVNTVSIIFTIMMKQSQFKSERKLSPLSIRGFIQYWISSSIAL